MRVVIFVLMVGVAATAAVPAIAAEDAPWVYWKGMQRIPDGSDLPSPRKEALAEAYQKARQAEMAAAETKRQSTVNQHLSLLESAIGGALIGFVLSLPGLVRSLHRRYGRRADVAMWSALGLFILLFCFPDAIENVLRVVHIIGLPVDRLGRVLG
jgi:hypothetical protein